ncbi:MAG TPA: amidohydrolase family protein, partial [Candidatus Acidoferrales bacterium]|nr:amidohydrolase family protein [Candidatus Acidoferrales bacterium]
MSRIIDIHIHIQPTGMLKPAALELVKRTRPDFADIERFSADPFAFLKFLDSVGVERAGLISYVSPVVIGYTAEVSDWNARYCAAAPERLIAFGSVHPKYAADAAAEVHRLAKIGIRALKIHPSHQLFAPNAYRDGLGPLGAIYERTQALGMPVMIHTGTSIFPGARNAYAQPMLADDV